MRMRKPKGDGKDGMQKINNRYMNRKDLREGALRLIDQYPHKSEEIRDLYSLAISEIEEGGSEENECSLAWRDMLESVNPEEEG